jgi:hypothetical protein
MADLCNHCVVASATAAPKELINLAGEYALIISVITFKTEIGLLRSAFFLSVKGDQGSHGVGTPNGVASMSDSMEDPSFLKKI